LTGFKKERPSYNKTAVSVQIGQDHRHTFHLTQPLAAVLELVLAIVEPDRIGRLAAIVAVRIGRETAGNEGIWSRCRSDRPGQLPALAAAGQS
jgi:hypothetical protein